MKIVVKITCLPSFFLYDGAAMFDVFAVNGLGGGRSSAAGVGGWAGCRRLSLPCPKAKVVSSAVWRGVAWRADGEQTCSIQQKAHTSAIQVMTTGG